VVHAELGGLFPVAAVRRGIALRFGGLAALSSLVLLAQAATVAPIEVEP